MFFKSHSCRVFDVLVFIKHFPLPQHCHLPASGVDRIIGVCPTYLHRADSLVAVSLGYLNEELSYMMMLSVCPLGQGDRKMLILCWLNERIINKVVSSKLSFHLQKFYQVPTSERGEWSYAYYLLPESAHHLSPPIHHGHSLHEPDHQVALGSPMWSSSIT